MLRALLLTAVAAGGFAVPASALDVPPLTGRVVDAAHLLPEPVVKTLSDDLAAHEARTGNQVAVLTLPSLEGEPLEEFSHRVATAWKLGQKGTDNGVLILVVPGDRKVRIEVGYGLEGTLTDAKSAHIIREEMTPRFRIGDFSGGIAAGVKAVLGTIEGTYAPPVETKRSDGQATTGSFGLFLLAVAVGILTATIIVLKGNSNGILIGSANAFLLGLSSGLVLAFVAAVIVALAIGLTMVFLELLERPQKGGVAPSSSSDDVWNIGGTGGSSRGSSFGGGGFFGGGGSFGGGGASGSW